MTFSSLPLPPGLKRLAFVIVLVLGTAAVWAIVRNAPEATRSPAPDGAAKKAAGPQPALTVTAITPHVAEWPQTLAASGNIVAWQETVISVEISNLRLTEVLVNVGDQVKKGQVLARINNETMLAELSQTRASVAEAEAMLAEARANGDRARQFQATGFISAQQINQYLTAEKTALARLNAARARMQTDELHLAQTTVRASDAGVISARTATAGSLAQPGQELFRLIRGGRLEWRAEVSAADLGKLKPGMMATLTPPDGERVQGRVRMVAPTVDPQTLNGLIYVDLPAVGMGHTLRAGTFARGEFELGHAPAMILPQSAVLLRDGFAYVFRLENGNKVAQAKVTLGRRVGNQIEITNGIEPGSRIVASGAGFLADGDSVRVVEAPAAGQSARK